MVRDLEFHSSNSYSEYTSIQHPVMICMDPLIQYSRQTEVVSLPKLIYYSNTCIT